MTMVFFIIEQGLSSNLKLPEMKNTINFVVYEILQWCTSNLIQIFLRPAQYLLSYCIFEETRTRGQCDDIYIKIQFLCGTF